MRYPARPFGPALSSTLVCANCPRFLLQFETTHGEGTGQCRGHGRENIFHQANIVERLKNILPTGPVSQSLTRIPRECLDLAWSLQSRKYTMNLFYYPLHHSRSPPSREHAFWRVGTQLRSNAQAIPLQARRRLDCAPGSRRTRCRGDARH